MSEDINKTNDERIAEEVHEKISPKEYVRRLREQGKLKAVKNANSEHIMDYEEKWHTVGYWISKLNTKDRFSTDNIYRQWKQWWSDDVFNSQFENRCLDIQKQLNEKYDPKRSKKENQEYFKKKMLHIRRAHYKDLAALLDENGLSEKYYVCDKSLYKKHPARLGKYAIYEEGHSPKEESKYFGTYEEIKNVIEELA